MASSIPRAKYVYTYTLALLPGVKEKDFEKQMSQEVMPQFQVLRRSIAGFEMEHRLFRSDAANRADKYVWQIRVLSIAMVSPKNDAYALSEMDKEVREKLSALAIPVSLTVLQEIGASETETK